MGAGEIAAIFTGIAAIIAIFFGKAYWGKFGNLIDHSQDELDVVRVDLRQLRKQHKIELEELREKLDRLREDHTSVLLERERLINRVDDYANANQHLMFDREKLQEELKEFEKEIKRAS